MSNDQVMCSIHCGLDVVPHHAASPATGRHRAGVWISQGDLLARFRKHPGLKPPKTLHLIFQRGDLVLKPGRFGLTRP